MDSASGTSKPLIGVIGKGFVGNAVYDWFKQFYPVAAWDSAKGFDTNCQWAQSDGHTEDTAYEMLAKSDAVFVCVPTPMRDDGSCDTSIVESCVERISDHCSATRPLVIIKSTVPPGTTAGLAAKYNDVPICFNPEFLREATAQQDFSSQTSIYIGRTTYSVDTAVRIYQESFGIAEKRRDYRSISVVSATEAELLKYATNSFLAAKCSFANELSQIAGKLGVDYAVFTKLLGHDPYRLGDSHWQVPGPDGHLGFGGKCFPKDLNALAACARQLGVKPTMLEAAWQKNLEVRPERDWEQIGGVLSEVKR